MRWLIVTCAACTADDPVACDTTTPWVRHTIAAGLRGADALDFADLDGDGRVDAAAGWELSGVVTLSLHPEEVACRAWRTVRLPGFGSVEDVMFADVDHDGRLEIVSASEVGGISIHYPPRDPSLLLDRFEWTSVLVEASLGSQRWMQLAFADLDGDGLSEIVAGGRGTESAIGYFAAPDPRLSSGWVFHPIAPVGWLMSLEPRDIDLDGDQDLVISDRHRIDWFDPPRYDLIGSRWLEQTPAGWINHTIHHPRAEGQPKFLHADANRVLDGSSSDGFNITTLRTTTDWETWVASPISQPENVGQYHDVAPGDLDGDLQEDLVFSYSDAGDERSGVMALRGVGSSWIPEDISGPAGTKFDNILLLDVDGDGDLDAVTSEQVEDLGVIWYENPYGSK